MEAALEQKLQDENISASDVKKLKDAGYFTAADIMRASKSALDAVSHVDQCSHYIQIRHHHHHHHHHHQHHQHHIGVALPAGCHLPDDDMGSCSPVRKSVRNASHHAARCSSSSKHIVSCR
jgi:hypothetical protein